MVAGTKHNSFLLEICPQLESVCMGNGLRQIKVEAGNNSDAMNV